MNGLIEVLRKELADYFSSLRFIILFIIVLLAGIGTIYIAAQTIRTGITENTEFIFIRLFILTGEDIPFSFPSFLVDQFDTSLYYKIKKGDSHIILMRNIKRGELILKFFPGDNNIGDV